MGITEEANEYFKRMGFEQNEDGELTGGKKSEPISIVPDREERSRSVRFVRDPKRAELESQRKKK